MKTIGCLVNTFLRRSEGFIYEQVVNVKKYNVEVFARAYRNREMFPWGKVNALQGIESLRYTLFREAGSFDKAIKEKNVKLLHAHFGVDGVYALPFAQKHKIPLVVTFHGQDITRLPKFKVFPPAWFNYWSHYHELQREGALFLGVSDFISRKLIEKGFPGEKVRTHYLGVNTNVETVSGKREKVILTVGRLVEKKGIEYLIRAMAEVVKTERDCKLLVCGEGPLRKSLEILTDKLKLKGPVEFVGWKSKNELQKLYGRASVFVLPSVTASDGDCEGLGMVFLEAMTHSLPVIGTNHGGIPDVIIDKETGFLVPERDSMLLADAIKTLINDRSLAERMGMKGNELVKEKFNITRQIEKLEAIYREFI